MPAFCCFCRLEAVYIIMYIKKGIMDIVRKPAVVTGAMSYRCRPLAAINGTYRLQTGICSSYHDGCG